MSDLKLVPPHEPTELERLLIEAAASEKPSAEHKLRVREALGLAIPLSIPPAAGAESSVTTTSAGASSSAGAAAVTKVVAGALVSAGAVGAVVFALVAPERSHPAPAPARAPAAVVERAEPVTRTVPTTPAPAPEATPAAETPAAKPEPRVKPAREQKAAPSEDDLRQQIVLIEAARAHVAQKNPWPALQALDEYAARFKGGSFDQEAAVLRMKAVDQTGDRERASALARSFLEKNPTSPHIERVRRIAEPAEPR